MVTHRLRASGLLWRGIGLVLVVAAAFLAVPVQPASAATATSVSAGNNYTCALTAPGGVKCWGDNFEGSLGDGTTTNRSAPVDVVGLTSGVGDISTRWFHACAVTTSGGLKCWGFNAYGQIGNGTTTDSATPLDVTGLTSGVSAVAIGFGHTCAVTTAGGLKCWGRNDWGQLGDGTFTPRLTPADVSRLTSGVVGVIAGFAHTCALTTAGGLKLIGAGAPSAPRAAGRVHSDSRRSHRSLLTRPLSPGAASSPTKMRWLARTATASSLWLAGLPAARSCTYLVR